MQAEARGDFCGREQRPGAGWRDGENGQEQAAPVIPWELLPALEWELSKETLVPERPAGTPTHGPAQQPPGAITEEQGGIPIPSAGLLQVTERRQPLSSVSSLEVHFDLLDLTELTDMSDQELAEVFADSDEENAAGEAPGGLQPVSRAGYLRSPSWTRAREQGREKKHLSDPELPPGPPDAFLPADRPREP